MKIKGIALVLAMLSLAGFVYGKGDVEERTVTAAAGAVPAGAEIEKVNPINVLPGTLVSVEGTGFGTAPRAIKVGGQTINTFLGWEDTAIFFRIPAAVQAGDRVQIGSATAPEAFKPAPEGSLTVQFTIDVSKVNDQSFDAAQKAKLAGPILFARPLYVKGEWIKVNAATWGNREASWDGGSRYRMVNASATYWIAEAVFTPQNLATFRLPNGRPRPMKFAFEDGDLTRNLVEFESDFAFALKKSFAATDTFASIHTDPALELSATFAWYSAEKKKIYAPYPTR